MDWCSVDGCENEVNRDGLCFRHKLKTLRFNTARLAATREANYTASEMKKEIYDGARRDGRDLTPVGGSKPHEVFKNGAWQSA